MNRLHGLALVLLLAAPTVGQASPRMAPGDLVNVRPGQMHPSQMDVGRVESNTQHYDRWRADADKRGMTLKKYAKVVLRKEFAKKGIEADVAPNGDVMPADAHHRLRALERIADETGYQVPVGVRIGKNYQGWKLEDFANDYVVQRGKGYFPPSFDKLTPVERVRRLPASFMDLENSPMRSAMGSVYRKLDIEDLRFENYAEFKIGDWLMKQGLMKNLARDGLLPPGHHRLSDAIVKDDRVIAAMSNVLRTDKGRAFLLDIAAEDQRKTLKKRLTSSLESANMRP